MFRKLIVIFILSGIFSCQNNKVSSEILDQKTYKEVLKEIILSNIARQQINANDSISPDLLSLIYKKYHIDSLQLKKTTDYYSNKPEILEKIYAEIEIEFKKQSDRIEKFKPKQQKTQTDSIKILKEKINLKSLIKNKKDA